jgi:hypothetical protein
MRWKCCFLFPCLLIDEWEKKVSIRFARAPPDMYHRFDVPKYPSPVDEKFKKLEELERLVAAQKKD